MHVKIKELLKDLAMFGDCILPEHHYKDKDGFIVHPAANTEVLIIK